MGTQALPPPNPRTFSAADCTTGKAPWSARRVHLPRRGRSNEAASVHFGRGQKGTLRHDGSPRCSLAKERTLQLATLGRGNRQTAGKRRDTHRMKPTSGATVLPCWISPKAQRPFKSHSGACATWIDAIGRCDAPSDNAYAQLASHKTMFIGSVLSGRLWKERLAAPLASPPIALLSASLT